MGMKTKTIQPPVQTANDQPDVPPGYKRTEVGVIPEDWEVKRVGEFTDCKAGGTPRTDVKEYWGGSIRWMSSGELNLKIVKEVAGRITERGLRESSATMFPAQCVLIGLAGQGKTRGTVAINMIELSTNQSIAAIYPNDRFVPDYLYHNLDFRYNELRSLSTGDGGRGGLNLRIIRSIEVPLPSVAEQRAIAEALSDVDGLIAALEKLIAKKRAIKQGAMQQLLTGKTRLPGFSGEWETKRIAEMLVYERPDKYIVTNTDYAATGDVPVLTANKGFILGYTYETHGICHHLPVIVFDDFTTDCKYVDFPFKVKSSAIKLLRPINDWVDLLYIFGRMQLIHFPIGEHKRYYISEYQKIELAVPDYDEQRAIAAVLSDMDAEIAALERQRDKTKQIKQGMMQQLLTGRVRLV